MKISTLIPLIALSVSINSSAEVIALNFDELAPGSNIRNTFYHGVLFTSETSDSITVFSGNTFGAGSSSPSNSISADSGQLGKGVVRVVFPKPISFMGVTGGDAGADIDRINIELYNSRGVLVGFFDSGPFGGNQVSSDGFFGDSLTANVFLSSPAAYATLIPIVQQTNGGGISWDDLRYEVAPPIPVPVSAPSTLGMFALILLGIYVSLALPKARTRLLLHSFARTALRAAAAMGLSLWVADICYALPIDRYLR